MATTPTGTVHPVRRCLLETAGIVALALGWSLAWNALDPQGLPLGVPIPPRAATDPAFLDHAAAVALWRNSPRTVFVDVRNLAAWRQGHLPGAVHLPADRLAEAWPTFAARQRPDDDLVLYCDGPHCELALRMRERLAAFGFTRLRVYEGGWEDWFASGLERATGDQ